MVVISEEEYKHLKRKSLLTDQKRKIALTKKNSKQIRKQILDNQHFVSGKTALQLSPTSVESFFTSVSIAGVGGFGLAAATWSKVKRQSRAYNAIR